MRAILVTNPSATTSAGWSRDVIVRALEASMDLSVKLTEHRGHATAIAAAARADGIDVIITLGGDGTVNEVINGLLSTDLGHQPLLASVPGGLANVFSRAVGFSSDAMEAAGQLIEALEVGRTRRIPLGRLNDRWFAFNAGIGFDALIVEAMEAQRQEGHRASPGRYAALAVKRYFETKEWRTPHLSIRSDDGRELDDVFMVIVQNTAPYVFVGPLSLDFATEASFNRELDIVALTKMDPAGLATYLAEAVAGIPTERRANVSLLDHCHGVTIHADQPVPVQVDGDHVGSFESVRITHVPDALEVLIPATD